MHYQHVQITHTLNKRSSLSSPVQSGKALVALPLDRHNNTARKHTC